MFRRGKSPKEKSPAKPVKPRVTPAVIPHELAARLLFDLQPGESAWLPPDTLGVESTGACYLRITRPMSLTRPDGDCIRVTCDSERRFHVEVPSDCTHRWERGKFSSWDSCGYTAAGCVPVASIKRTDELSQ